MQYCSLTNWNNEIRKLICCMLYFGCGAKTPADLSILYKLAKDFLHHPRS